MLWLEMRESLKIPPILQLSKKKDVPGERKRTWVLRRGRPACRARKCPGNLGRLPGHMIVQSDEPRWLSGVSDGPGGRRRPDPAGRGWSVRVRARNRRCRRRSGRHRRGRRVRHRRACRCRWRRARRQQSGRCGRTRCRSPHRQRSHSRRGRRGWRRRRRSSRCCRTSGRSRRRRRCHYVGVAFEGFDHKDAVGIDAESTELGQAEVGIIEDLQSVCNWNR